MKQSLGIMEITGLVYTIACADAALKAADVRLLGYESSRGGACFVLKFLGNVGAVRAALDAALALARKDGKEAVGYAIPRPSDGCWEMVQKTGTDPAFAATLKTEPANAATPETEPADTDVPETEPTDAAMPETEAADAIGEDTAEEQEFSPAPETKPGICNICNDPACPRRKSEPHNLCIHFEENEK